MKLSISKIHVDKNRREINESKVDEIAESIEEIGLLNQITVTKNGDDYKLVAGAHRLKAFQKLGRKEIPAHIINTSALKIELAEIDENLIRNELHWTEQDDQIARRKEIYEQLYPETKAGGDHGNQHTGGKSQNLQSAKSFTKDASNKTGKSERSISESVRRSKGLTPKAKKVFKNKDLPKYQANEISRKDPEEQNKIADKLESGEATDYKDYQKKQKQKHLEQKKEEIKKQESSDIECQPIVKKQSYKEYLSGLKDDSFDLLITDPPFSTDIDNIDEFANSWLPAALSKVKKTGRGYICIGAYPEEIQAYLSIFEQQSKFILDSPLIWTYRNTLGRTPKRKYNLNYQIILHFYSQDSEDLDTSITKEMFSVQEINAPDGRQGNRFHKWQKPNELARRLIRHSTREGDFIIDPFCGSGTFLVEAGRLKRNAVGCDIDGKAIKICKERGCEVQ